MPYSREATRQNIEGSHRQLDTVLNSLKSQRLNSEGEDIAGALQDLLNNSKRQPGIQADHQQAK